MSTTVVLPTHVTEHSYRYPVLVKVEIEGQVQWFADVYRDELREIQGAFHVLKVVEE